MEPLSTAPPIVAVVVTCDPGPWLDEALQSLGDQDYPNLSVLVVDSGSRVDPTPRVAATLPDAFVQRLGRRVAFGVAANEALTLVEGASYFLLCHDDVALASSAVSVMAEEAVASNAGMITPKVLEWDRPERLVAVGIGADRQGILHPLVEPGELDQEQHDAVRDVFVAPGGATLIRADLFTLLGGYRPEAAPFGEDLDLSWRVHLAGARVVAAPEARVRHRQVERHGERSGWTSGPARRQAAELGEEHRLRTVLTCYSGLRLARLLPVLVAYVLGEAAWELVRGHAGRSGAVVRAAWRALTAGPSLRASRHAVAGIRHASDHDLTRLQARGNVRLRRFLRSAIEDGPLPGVPIALTEEAEESVQRRAWDDPTATEPTDRGAALVPVERVRRRGRELSPETTALVTSAIGRGSWRLPVSFGLGILILLLIGSRSLFAHDLPAIAQLPVTAGGVGRWWHDWWSNTSDGGLGGAALGPPGLALVGLAGIVTFGATGTLQHLLVLLPLIVGPLGAYRAARWWGSLRGRVVAMVFYAAVPLAYNALAAGRWPGLLACAAAPWTLGLMGRLSSQIPFPPSLTPRITGRVIGLGALTALVAAFAPSWLYTVAGTGIALWLGSLLTDRPRAALRLVGVGVAGALVGVVLLFPWSLRVLANGNDTFGTFGGPAARLGLGQVLEFHTGPVGAGPLGWLLLLAAALPLVLGRSWRLAWAARLWILALASFAMAWMGLRGWIPIADPAVVLAPAAAALAGSAALGAVAFELDLPGYRFGWRQAASGVAALALLVGSIPVLIAIGDGHWRLPTSDAPSALSFLSGESRTGYRVLWVGAPSALPLASRQLSTGVGFATSWNGAPDLAYQWGSAQVGGLHRLAGVLRLASEGRTTTLGHQLDDLGVRYVVVPNQTAPAGTGGHDVPTPRALLDGLALQTDLLSVSPDTSYTVYANTAWTPTGSGAPAPSTTRRVLELVDVGLWVVAGAGMILDRRRRSVSRVVEVAQPAWFAPIAPARRADAFDPGGGSRSGLSSGESDYDVDEMWVDD